MRILLNDIGDMTVGSTRVHIYNMGYFLKNAGADISWNDWQSYTDYDIAIFGKNTQAQHLAEARKQNPNLLIGELNPSTSPGKLAKAQLANFFIAGCIEERDFYLKFNKPILIFPQIEIFKTPIKVHKKKEETTIGYHGNKMHIEALSLEFISAMNKLHKTHNISFHLLYDIKNLGKAPISGAHFRVQHTQWQLDTFASDIQKFDIGVAPGLTRMSALSAFVQKWLPGKGGFPTDYHIRFKNTANMGRVSVFIQLGIPVVADMTPCHFSILSKPGAGYIAMSKEGWYIPLRELASSATLRNTVAKNAFEEFSHRYDTRSISEAFINELATLLKNAPNQSH